MTRIVSLNTKIQQLHGLLGTHEVNEWETDFISSVWGWSREGKDTRTITERQIEVIERIWGKHFAG
ncbi:MAG: hypothetical protein IT529_06250 [Burkholderiales bacterium]|nr:hypothetical protein [Burkholderiales bacterium]